MRPLYYSMLLLFKDGQPVDMSVGVKSKAELENFLK